MNVKNVEVCGFLDNRRFRTMEKLFETTAIMPYLRLEDPRMLVKRYDLADLNMLLEELEIIVTTDKEHLIFSFEKGFLHDWASVPDGIAQAVVKGSGADIIIAALIHDGLYGTHLFSRAQSDLLFREICKYCGMGFFKRYSAYYSVRAGGAGAWKKASKSLNYEKRFFNVKKLPLTMNPKMVLKKEVL